MSVRFRVGDDKAIRTRPYEGLCHHRFGNCRHRVAYFTLLLRRRLLSNGSSAPGYESRCNHKSARPHQHCDLLPQDGLLAFSSPGST